MCFVLNMTLPVQVTPLLCLLFVCPAFCLQVRNASSAVSQRCSRDSASENPASISFTCTLMMLTSTSVKDASAKSEPLGFKGHPASRLPQRMDRKRFRVGFGFAKKFLITCRSSSCQVFTWRTSLDTDDGDPETLYSFSRFSLLPLILTT